MTWWNALPSQWFQNPLSKKGPCLGHRELGCIFNLTILDTKAVSFEMKLNWWENIDLTGKQGLKWELECKMILSPLGKSTFDEGDDQPLRNWNDKTLLHLQLHCIGFRDRKRTIDPIRMSFRGAGNKCAHLSVISWVKWAVPYSCASRKRGYHTNYRKALLLSFPFWLNFLSVRFLRLQNVISMLSACSFQIFFMVSVTLKVKVSSEAN